MADGFALFIKIDVGPDFLKGQMQTARQHAGEQRLKRNIVVQGGGDFDAITGGDDERFARTARLHVEQSRGDVFGAKRQLFAKLNGRCLVIDTG